MRKVMYYSDYQTPLHKTEVTYFDRCAPLKHISDGLIISSVIKSTPAQKNKYAIIWLDGGLECYANTCTQYSYRAVNAFE